MTILKTFGDLFQSLKAAAVAELKKLETEAADEFAILKTTVLPVIEADVVAVLKDLEGIAMAAIVEIAKDVSMPGHEKFGVVVTRVFQAAEAQGKSVVLQDIQMFVQQAYNALATSLQPPVQQ